MEPVMNLGELAYAQLACVLSAGKMADCTVSREGALDLCNGAVSEKMTQILLPTEYVAAFSW